LNNPDGKEKNMKEKDCKECIKNNQKPNAVGCLGCSKYKKLIANIGVKSNPTERRKYDS